LSELSAAVVYTTGRRQKARSVSPSADGGKELAKGVKRVLGEGPSVIPGDSKVSMRNVIFEPGATVPPNEIMNAVVCRITQGEESMAKLGIMPPGAHPRAGDRGAIV
jgi:hypothetical protein